MFVRLCVPACVGLWVCVCVLVWDNVKTYSVLCLCVCVCVSVCVFVFVFRCVTHREKLCAGLCVCCVGVGVCSEEPVRF